MNAIYRCAAIAQHKIFTCLVIGLFGLAVSACSPSDIEVTANFVNTTDIDEGTAVYFNETEIGQVSDVSIQQGGSRVALRLDPQATSLVYAQSAVVVNRLKPGAPLEIFNRETGNTEPLVAGQEIEGLDSMVQLGAWVLGDAIQVGVGAISEYVDAFQDYLQSDDFQNDKNQFELDINGAAVSAEQAMQALGKELNDAMAELAENEEEIAAAVEDLGDQLAPVVEGLGKSGSRLAQEMENFATSLESSDPEERQAGQQVVESLIAMLERLSVSLEKGATEPINDTPSEKSN